MPSTGSLRIGFITFASAEVVPSSYSFARGRARGQAVMRSCGSKSQLLQSIGFIMNVGVTFARSSNGFTNKIARKLETESELEACSLLSLGPLWISSFFILLNSLSKLTCCLGGPYNVDEDLLLILCPLATRFVFSVLFP